MYVDLLWPTIKDVSRAVNDVVIKYYTYVNLDV